jgi:hypothetical protein
MDNAIIYIRATREKTFTVGLSLSLFLLIIRGDSKTDERMDSNG